MKVAIIIFKFFYCLGHYLASFIFVKNYFTLNLCANCLICRRRVSISDVSSFKGSTLCCYVNISINPSFAIPYSHLSVIIRRVKPVCALS